MSVADRVPAGIDTRVATAARMYDYWLGGHDNFAADRIAALKVAERIDFTQPLAVLFVAVLHFVGDPDAHEAVARFAGRTAPGSYLVLSHVTQDEVDPQTVATGTAVYASTANPIIARPRAKILEFFDGLDIVQPGLVPVAQWRPDEHEPVAVGQGLLGGVGKKLA